MNFSVSPMSTLEEKFSKVSLFKILFLSISMNDSIVDFNGMSIGLGLFYTDRLKNCVHCKFNLLCNCLFSWGFFHTPIWYQVFLSSTNNLYTVLWFQVSLSNTNNYMVSRNHFYLIISICLHTIIWFQVTNNNP